MTIGSQDSIGTTRSNMKVPCTTISNLCNLLNVFKHYNPYFLFMPCRQKV
jgi:hypothetical protein